MRPPADRTGSPGPRVPGLAAATRPGAGAANPRFPTRNARNQDAITEAP